VICLDPIFGAEFRAPCGHFYDINCITNLFQAATRQESLYPPRCCCQIIPLPHVQKHLTQPLLAEFKLKAREFGTMKRVYCAAPACSRFLGPLSEVSFKTYACPSPICTTVTCGRCRTKYEKSGHKCTSDAETESVLTLSRASGWSRCPGCTQMIELEAGCNHIICPCKTEFCYVCCARWKTCTCSVWDLNRWLTAVVGRAYARLQYAIRGLLPNNPFRPLEPRVDQPALVFRNAMNQLLVVDLPQPPRPAPFVNIRLITALFAGLFCYIVYTRAF